MNMRSICNEQVSCYQNEADLCLAGDGPHLLYAQRGVRRDWQSPKRACRSGIPGKWASPSAFYQRTGDLRQLDAANHSNHITEDHCLLS
jgi:hypothetical protein